jgi:hypothetical protein
LFFKLGHFSVFAGSLFGFAANYCVVAFFPFPFFQREMIASFEGFVA